MDWNLIQTFLAVVDEGSLSGGSNKLGISQPTAGRHINELESSLGLTLFVRGRSGMTLR
ncbi:MAG: LysR family transcriptional regulator [Leucothrix sp.]